MNFSYFYDPEVTRISANRNAALIIKRLLAERIALSMDRANKAETSGLQDHCTAIVSVGSLVSNYVDTLIAEYTKQLNELRPDSDNQEDYKEKRELSSKLCDG